MYYTIAVTKIKGEIIIDCLLLVDSSGDEGLIPTRKVTTQRPELFREKRMEKREEIPP